MKPIRQRRGMATESVTQFEYCREEYNGSIVDVSIWRGGFCWLLNFVLQIMQIFPAQ